MVSFSLLNFLFNFGVNLWNALKMFNRAERNTVLLMDESITKRAKICNKRTGKEQMKLKTLWMSIHTLCVSLQSFLDICKWSLALLNEGLFKTQLSFSLPLLSSVSKSLFLQLSVSKVSLSPSTFIYCGEMPAVAPDICCLVWFNSCLGKNFVKS